MTDFTFKVGDRVAFNHAFMSFIGHPNAERDSVAAHREARGTILAVNPDMSRADGSQLIDVLWDGDCWSRMGLNSPQSSVQSSNLDLADAPDDDPLYMTAEERFDAAAEAVASERKIRHKVVFPAKAIPNDVETHKDGRISGHCPECGRGPWYTLKVVPLELRALFRGVVACAVCVDTELGLYNPTPSYEDDNATLYEAIRERIPAATYDHTGGGCMVTYATTPLGLFTLGATDEAGIVVTYNGSAEDISDDELVKYGGGTLYPEQEVAEFSLYPRWGYLLPSDVEALAAAADDLYRWACEMEKPDAERTTVVVTLEGGLIQAISTLGDHPEIEVVTIDLDARENGEPEDEGYTILPDGSPAWVFLNDNLAATDGLTDGWITKWINNDL